MRIWLLFDLEEVLVPNGKRSMVHALSTQVEGGLHTFP